ncbi:MAG: SDR family NAD(P)-dependent oxidoreductase [Acetobacteraceae bacterium]
MAEFAGQRIAITGGAGGIGVATARRFLGGGAHVLLIDRDAARLEAAEQVLGTDHLTAWRSDLADPLQCATALEQAGGKVAALVHLAGLFEPDPLAAEDHGVWDRAIAANLTTAYDMAVAFIPRAAPPAGERGPARIVFASSLAFRRGSPDRAAYAAAKGGLVGLTRSLARKFAPDMLVNAVAPGVIDTSMAVPIIAERGDRYRADIPLRRWGRPKEVAGVIHFLCSRDSSYVTGQTVTVDGGITNA